MAAETAPAAAGAAAGRSDWVQQVCRVDQMRCRYALWQQADVQAESVNRVPRPAISAGQLPAFIHSLGTVTVC